jgi:thiamine pyrophosphokinase
LRRVVFVICGGPIGDPAFLIRERDRHEPAGLICADGGARHLLAQGMTPDLIIGDMDSLDVEIQRELVVRGSRIIRYPEAKDETDAELALKMAFMMSPDEIRIYGAIGARIDHTLANLSLLAVAAENGVEARLLDEWCEITLIRRSGVIDGEVGQTVSLFAFGSEAAGVTLEGFEYPLRDGTLVRFSPLGVSNRLAAARGVVTVASGDVLAIRYLNAGRFPAGA